MPPNCQRLNLNYWLSVSSPVGGNRQVAWGRRMQGCGAQNLPRPCPGLHTHQDL